MDAFHSHIHHFTPIHALVEDTALHSPTNAEKTQKVQQKKNT